MRSRHYLIDAFIAVLLVSMIARAQDVDLVLPPRSKSAAVGSFVFIEPTRAFLGTEDAVCDLDLARKSQACLSVDGAISSLVATTDGDQDVVIHAAILTPAPNTTPDTCTIALRVSDPRRGESRVLTQFESTDCLSPAGASLLASRSPQGLYLTVATDHALRVFALRAGRDGFEVEESWRYGSQPREAGWMASGISVASSNRAVYVMELWNDFSEGQVEVFRRQLDTGRTERLLLPTPASFDGMGPSFLLASPDDAHLLLVGQVGADPGHFVSYDPAGRSPRCHFTNRSLRALNPGRHVRLLDGGAMLVASTEGEVLELDACGTRQAGFRIDYLPVQLPFGLRGLQPSPDGRLLYALLQDGAISVFDRDDDRVLATLYLLEQDEWVALLPEGFYSSSRRGHDYLGILFRNERIGLNQFYDAFYRPDLVDRRLSGKPVADLVTTTLEQAIRQPPPRVEILSVPDDGVSGPAPVRYRVQSAGGGIGEVRVYHNGKLVWSDGSVVEPPGLFADAGSIRANTPDNIIEEQRGIAVAQALDHADVEAPRRMSVASDPKGDLFDGTVQITPVSGANEVTVTAFNGSNTVQSRMRSASFQSAAPARSPRLHILAVGIDDFRAASARLNYAAKDARDFATTLRERARSLFPEEQIRATVFTDDEATRGRLLDYFAQVTDDVSPEDHFVLFIATHGILKGNQYYMLTHDYDGTVRRDSVISSAELVEFSRRVSALSQLVILDSCHAGGVDGVVAGLYDARISVLARNMGLHVYASAGSVEAALDGYRGNGLFTHALLQGLDNNRGADDDRNGEVSVVELGRFADALTRTIAERLGHRQRPLLIEFGLDRSLYRLAATGASRRR